MTLVQNLVMPAQKNADFINKGGLWPPSITSVGLCIHHCSYTCMLRIQRGGNCVTSYTYVHATNTEGGQLCHKLHIRTCYEYRGGATGSQQLHIHATNTEGGGGNWVTTAAHTCYDYRGGATGSQQLHMHATNTGGGGGQLGHNFRGESGYSLICVSPQKNSGISDSSLAIWLSV